MTTIGGFDISQEWTSDNQKRLGGIVFNLVSGIAKDRRRGYLDYFEMRREFDRDIWDRFIAGLDSYRVSNGFTSVTVIVDGIRMEMITEGQALDCNPEPAEFNILPVIEPIEWSDRVEQVSLF